MKKKILYWIVCLGLFTISCGDFLEDYSQDLTYASSCADLEELLIGNGYIKQNVSTSFAVTGDDGFSCPWIHVMDDDAIEPDRKQQYSGAVYQLEEFHHWAKNPFQNEGKTFDDAAWKDWYARIAIANVVIPKVDDMLDDPEEERNRIKGEALFLRAGFYFLLTNFYGLPYREASAATDLSVPLKLTEYIEDKYYSRNTVKEVFESIENDLKQAVLLLKGVEQTTVYQANEAAARLLLSRVYLYMERWENAVAQCDSIMLLDKYSCLDFNTVDASKSCTYASSPETIFSQGTYSMDFIMSETNYSPYYHYGWVVSDDLLKIYDEKDLRRSIYHTPTRMPGVEGTTDGTFRCIKLKDKNKDGYVSDMFLLRYPEVILNKAEALAMLGREDDSKACLQELRSNLFKGVDLQSVVETGDDYITFVRDERRRELCFEGHRWFDLRRYAVSTIHPFTKEIIHPHYDRWAGSGSGVGDERNEYQFTGNYRLKKYNEETAYVLPIPEYAMTYNNGTLVQNEREDRKINN